MSLSENKTDQKTDFSYSKTYGTGINCESSGNEFSLSLTLFGIILLSCVIGFFFERFSLLIDLETGTTPVRIVRKAENPDFDSQMESYAEPAAALESIITYETHTEPQYQFQGLEIIDVPDYAQKYYHLPQGIYIVSKSNTANADLLRGDIIVKIDSSSINQLEDIVHLNPEDINTYTVFRDGSYIEIAN